MRFVIYDLEIYKFDNITGIKVIDVDNEGNLLDYEYIQIHNDLDLLVDTLLLLKDDIWVGWNIEFYDNPVLSEMLKASDTQEMIQRSFEVSCKLIDERDNSWVWKTRIPFNYIDLMKEVGLMNSLKIMESNAGLSIEELPLPALLDRPLTPEELEIVLHYNRHDLDATHLMLEKSFSASFKIKKSLIDYFNLDMSNISKPLATLTAIGLGAKPGIWKEKKIKDVLEGRNITIDNPEVRDFYLNEKWKKGEIKFELAGIKHRGGLGGLHGARECCYYDEIWDLDVKGYYSLIMMDYGLLSRAIDPTSTMGRDSPYGILYYERLRLKKIDPELALALKTALLTVFGATQNKHQLLYDPSCGDLIMILGQMAIIDLIEKVSPYCEYIQTNTDGIMLFPYNKEKITEIYKDWEKRTGFELELTVLKKFYQKDVNNYVGWNEEEKKPHIKGQLIVNYEREQNYFPYYVSINNGCIRAKAIVDYLLYDIPVEDTIMNAKGRDPRSFMFTIKKGAYEYCKLVKDDQIIENGCNPKVNRVFASKLPGSTYIYKYKNGRPNKFADVPTNIFVFNKDLDQDWKEEMWEWIDYDWYIYSSYQRIADYLGYKTKK